MKKLFPILLSVFIAFSYGAKKEIEKYPNGNKKSQVKLNKEGGLFVVGLIKCFLISDILIF